MIALSRKFSSTRHTSQMNYDQISSGAIFNQPVLTSLGFLLFLPVRCVLISTSLLVSTFNTFLQRPPLSSQTDVAVLNVKSFKFDSKSRIFWVSPLWTLLSWKLYPGMFFENKLIICALGNLHYQIRSSEVRIPVQVQVFLLRSDNVFLMSWLRIACSFLVVNVAIVKSMCFINLLAN